MALTEMQKKIINDNPKMHVRDLAKMVKCDPKTITNYRKKLKELPKDESVEISQVEIVENCGKNLTCARDYSVVGNSTLQEIRKSDLMLSSEDLLKIGSFVTIDEIEQYKLAQARLSLDPDNPKLLWTVKQHYDSIVKTMSVMGKWHGLERETSVNILNINNKNVGLTDKQMERYIELSKKVNRHGTLTERI